MSSAGPRLRHPRDTMPSATATLLSPVHSAARLLLSLHVLPLVVAYTALLWLRLALSSVSCRLRLERRRSAAMVCLYENCLVRVPDAHRFAKMSFQLYRSLCIAVVQLPQHAWPPTARRPLPGFAASRPPCFPTACCHVHPPYCAALCRGATTATSSAPGAAWSKPSPLPPLASCALAAPHASACCLLCMTRCLFPPPLPLPVPPGSHPPAAHFLLPFPCPLAPLPRSWPRLRRFTLYFDDVINYPAERCRASLGFVVAAGCAGGCPPRLWARACAWCACAWCVCAWS